ncbi:hypothetical protein HELRODRAFT_85052 [Helobdella robusta]|uniref:Uncharacterized protein n=1 Tax=Helobdella robusta TaxID=6412 RepID=T1G5S3_HELRO|nr:hypothetical protein HELRODRAFT_85052 [Helobdella robusta]ESN98011.1 hypothetical protein HELRODRAFT_85052 [Helobdella robusta]
MHGGINASNGTAANNANCNYLRLPRNLLPKFYEVLVHPDLLGSTFQGWASVEVGVVNSTDLIVMHAKQLNISSIDVRYKDRNEEIEMEKYRVADECEQLYIELRFPLLEGAHLFINLSFFAALRKDSSGFFIESYKTSKGDEKYLAATFFEPTEARSAFPCFDEPNMKAKFKFNVIRPNNFISLFNTEKVTTGEMKVSDAETMDIFEKTVKMSTFLLAFVVCDFQSKSTMTRSGVNVSVFSPSETISDVDFSLNISTRMLEFFEEFYQTKYPLKKIDHVPVPSLKFKGMESWGLLLYNSSYLLYNENESTEEDKKELVSIVAHVLARQWFGNLVTMDWWSDWWLINGFATFVEGIGAKHVFSGWPLLEDETSDHLASALHYDSLAYTYPLSFFSEDPDKIKNTIYSILNLKAAYIMTMLHDAVGSDLFRASLKHYLDKHKFGNVHSEDFWDSFAQELNWGSQTNVREMMNTWTLQKGYPLISISRNGKKVTCRQNKFVENQGHLKFK